MNIGIIDIETTGFLREGGFIVEVGIASLDTSTGKIEPVYDQVCREKGMTAKDRNAWIFQNSTLTVEEVRDAPDFTEIFGAVQRHLNGFDGVTAYNKEFDLSFLRSRGMTISNEIQCPMHVCTPLCKLPGKYGDYKWPKVEEAWAHLFPMEHYVELHRGLDDAMHEAQIVWQLVKRGLM